MPDLVNSLASGLAIGGVYALLTAAHVLARGLLRSAWLSMAAVFVLAFALCLAIAPHIIHLPILVCALILAASAGAVGGVLGAISHSLLDRPLAGQSRLTAVAAGVALFFLARVVLLHGFRVFPDSLPSGFGTFLAPIVALASIVILIGLWVLLHTSRAGLAMRAIIGDADQASTIGIHIPRMTRLGLVTAGVVAAIAAAGWFMTLPLPTFGLSFTAVFTAILLSFLSPPGALLKPASIAWAIGLFQMLVFHFFSTAIAGTASLLLAVAVVLIHFPRGWRHHDTATA